MTILKHTVFLKYIGYISKTIYILVSYILLKKNNNKIKIKTIPTKKQKLFSVTVILKQGDQKYNCFIKIFIFLLLVIIVKLEQEHWL